MWKTIPNSTGSREETTAAKFLYFSRRNDKVTMTTSRAQFGTSMSESRMSYITHKKNTCDLTCSASRLPSDESQSVNSWCTVSCCTGEFVGEAEIDYNINQILTLHLFLSLSLLVLRLFAQFNCFFTFVSLLTLRYDDLFDDRCWNCIKFTCYRYMRVSVTVFF